MQGLVYASLKLFISIFTDSLISCFIGISVQHSHWELALYLFYFYAWERLLTALLCWCLPHVLCACLFICLCLTSQTYSIWNTYSFHTCVHNIKTQAICTFILNGHLKDNFALLFVSYHIFNSLCYEFKKETLKFTIWLYILYVNWKPKFWRI